MEKNQYDWVDFYREFASILLDYKNRRDELIEKVVAIYAMTGISMPTLERDNQLVDIDPFTVFGLFNKKLTDENRINILTAIAELFGVKTAVPTSFDSLPVLNPQNATFYYFVDQRGAEDIDDLWGLYESALAYAQSPTAENRKAMSRDFDLIMNKKGNGNSKITMALYWIAPDVFLNLDRRNRWYIYESGKLPATFVKQLPEIESKMPAAKYFEITEAMKRYLQSDESPFKDFKELSFEAWVYSEQVNKEKSEEKENKISNASILQWFAPLIQALRDLGGSATPAEARAKIIENENLTEEEISVTRGKNNVNKFENEVAFARSYLVNAGYIDKSVYGVWTLTEAGMTVDMTRELASDIFKSVFSSGSVK